MNKKIFAALLCVVLMLLVGCSAKPAPSTPADPTEASVELNESCIEDIKARGYLTVGCKMDVPELGYYDKETDTFSGLEVDLAYQIAAKIFDKSVDEVKEHGYLNIVGVTVADREEKLANGDIDLMLATYTITDERKQSFAISNSYYTDQIGIMVKSGKTDSETMGGSEIKSISDLDGKYIGVPRNATTRNDFLNYLDTMNTIKVTPIFCEYESYDVLYNALIKGNIDAMAVDVSILNGYKTSSTKILGARFASQNYGAAAKLENAKLIDLVNEVIADSTKQEFYE